MDFIHGSALSKQGKPILVLPSQTSKGVSRIVNTVRVPLLHKIYEIVIF